MNIEEFLKKTYLERNQFLSYLTPDQRASFLKTLALEASERVSLTDILSLDESFRNMITPELLIYVPTFKLEVLQKVHLEVKTSGGGRRGQDRVFLEISPGVKEFSFKKAALLMDLYGPDAEISNQRGKVREFSKGEHSPRSENPDEDSREKKRKNS